MVYVVDIVHFIIHFELDLPFHVFFSPYSLVFTWSFSLAKEKMHLVLVILNYEYGKFSIIMKVMIIFLICCIFCLILSFNKLRVETEIYENDDYLLLGTRHMRNP